MGGHNKKLITPDDLHWFVLFLCSRWGKTISEIESMPLSELLEHKQFWMNYKWGMTDDLLSMTISHEMKRHSSKTSVEPWMVKDWTTQRDYTYRITQLIVKPASALRSGFFAIYDAIRAMNKKK